MLDRVEDENQPVHLVLACVAYYNYKLEKRKWITDWTDLNKNKPSATDVDYFVSTWNDYRIDGAFAQARQYIEEFAESVVEDATNDISEEVYQKLFRSLSDQIKEHTSSSQERAKNLSNLVTLRTKGHPIRSFINDVAVSVIANFLWFALTIVILIGLYAQFDFTKVLERSKGLFAPQEQPAVKQQPDNKRQPQNKKSN